ncbi:amino acid permease [Xylariales sp. PMI_506]|nr:amino acid permease [Xylariales sp. PMI_506]
MATEAVASDTNTEPGVIENADGNEGVRRELSRRHINMIGLAGMIGTGLFLASGQALAIAGPVGALLGYLLMSFLTASVSLSIAEISSFMPITGGFIRHASRFLQPAFGAATGWNYWYMMCITGPAELSAAATLIGFWNTSISPAVWYTVFIVVIVAMNFCGVRVYGEAEVFFSILKILLIIGLILAGIIVNAGGSPTHEYIGFKYWVTPGPFNEYLVGGNTGKFLGFFSTLISAAYAFCNIQVVALAGAETKNPRKLIPDAMKMTFWRVIVFYVLSMFIVGILVPSNDPNLGNSSGTAQQSPFVIAFQNAGIQVLPSIINAVLITSAFSCGAAVVFLASRVLYGLAQEGQAPKLFLKTNRFGAPYYSVAISLIFLPLVYLSLGSNSSVAFGWFVNIATIAALLSWVIIEVTYLRFFYGMKAQGISRDRLPYHSPFQPYMAWITTAILVVITLGSGYVVFLDGHWNTNTFLTYYIGLPIFLVLWGGSYIYFRAPFVRLSEMDLSEIEVIDREREAEVEEKKLPWYRVLA